MSKAFPHAALEPAETIPRITPDQAREVLALIEAREDLYPAGAAILIAVWTNKGALVKYLIDGWQVEETIRRLRAPEKGAKT